MTSRILTLDDRGWTAPAGADAHAERLEAGDVLFWPSLAFEVDASELSLFTPAVVGSSKNVSFDPATGRVRGTAAECAERGRLAGMLARFSAQADAFVRRLLPCYGDRLARGRASFRPVEIAGRASSWRKDDTRLHIDSFPATPVHAQRILRLF